MCGRCSESRDEILVREDSTISGYDRTYYHTPDSSVYETQHSPVVSLSLLRANAADCVCVFFPARKSRLATAAAAAAVSLGMRFYCRPVGTLSWNYQSRIRAVRFL